MKSGENGDKVRRGRAFYLFIDKEGGTKDLFPSSGFRVSFKVGNLDYLQFICLLKDEHFWRHFLLTFFV